MSYIVVVDSCGELTEEMKQGRTLYLRTLDDAAGRT